MNVCAGGGREQVAAEVEAEDAGCSGRPEMVSKWWWNEQAGVQAELWMAVRQRRQATGGVTVESG